MNETLKSPTTHSDDSDSCCSQGTCSAPQPTVKRTQPKIGRNDPCPCDSGKKFKKCCGVNA